MNKFISRIRKLIYLVAACMGLSKNKKLLIFLYRLKDIDFKKLYLDFLVLADDTKKYLGYKQQAFLFEVIQNEGRTGFKYNLGEKIV